VAKFFTKGVDQLVWSKPIIVIVSILLSLFIWLFVVDPVKTITFSIPIKTVALAPDKTIDKKNLVVLSQDIPSSNEITLVGRASFLDAIQMDKYYSTIDFSKIDSSGNKVLSVEGPFGEMKGVKVIEMSQKTVQVQVDKLNDSIVQVDIRLLGSPREGYKVITKTVAPVNIQLVGSEALLKKASKAIVDVDISNIDVGFEETKYVKIIDENGIELKGTEKQYQTLVSIGVAKEVPVIPVLQGAPMSGFSYLQGSATVSPKTVLLKGTKDLLDSISSIYTKPLSITGLTEDTILDAELKVVKGITVYGRNNFVKVTVPVQGLISRQVQIPSSLLKYNHINANFTYKVIANSIVFSVRGSSNVVNNMNELLLQPTVDVQGLGVGQYTLVFEALLPSNCSFDGKHEVLISIEKIIN